MESMIDKRYDVETNAIAAISVCGMEVSEEVSKYVEQLIEILNREYEGYAEYSKLAEEKQKVILAGDVKLEDRRAGTGMTVTMGKMEQIRKVIIGNILLENNVSGWRILRSCRIYSEPQRTELLKIRYCGSC